MHRFTIATVFYAGAVAVFFFGNELGGKNFDRDLTIYVFTKVLPIALLAGFSLLLTPNGAHISRLAMCAAFLFCAGGDYILADKPGKRQLCYGSMVFLVGHVFHALAYSDWWIDWWWTRWVGLLWTVLSVLNWFQMEDADLRPYLTVYSVGLFASTMLAMSFWLHHGRQNADLLRVGAVWVFNVSDVILCVWLTFLPTIPTYTPARIVNRILNTCVMVTYYSAQLLFFAASYYPQPASVVEAD